MSLKEGESMDKKYEALKIENQICFPLYAASREVIKQYTPLLDDLNLTYTQYITMLVLWEYGEMNVKELGRRLLLDSGTLTPLLKKLEIKGLLTRKRSAQDERSLIVRLTPAGEALRERAVQVPEKMASCVKLPQKDAVELYRILYQLLPHTEE